MARIRQRLTYANVVSTLALFLVLTGGAAYAAKKINGHQLKGGSITAAKIKHGAVTASKLRRGSVKANKIAKEAVGNDKLAVGAVTADTLVSGFVAPTAEKLARSADISAEGGVLIGSVGIAQANVSHPSPGFYCFSGLSPAPAGGVATVDYSEAGENILIQLDTGQGPVCPAGTQAFVNPRKTLRSSEKTEPVDAGFFVVFY